MDPSKPPSLPVNGNNDGTGQEPNQQGNAYNGTANQGSQIPPNLFQPQYLQQVYLDPLQNAAALQASNELATTTAGAVAIQNNPQVTATMNSLQPPQQALSAMPTQALAYTNPFYLSPMPGGQVAPLDASAMLGSAVLPMSQGVGVYWQQQPQQQQFQPQLQVQTQVQPQQQQQQQQIPTPIQSQQEQGQQQLQQQLQQLQQQYQLQQFQVQQQPQYQQYYQLQYPLQQQLLQQPTQPVQNQQSVQQQPVQQQPVQQQPVQQQPAQQQPAQQQQVQQKQENQTPQQSQQQNLQQQTQQAQQQSQQQQPEQQQPQQQSQQQQSQQQQSQQQQQPEQPQQQHQQNYVFPLQLSNILGNSTTGTQPTTQLNVPNVFSPLQMPTIAAPAPAHDPAALQNLLSMIATLGSAVVPPAAITAAATSATTGQIHAAKGTEKSRNNGSQAKNGKSIAFLDTKKDGSKCSSLGQRSEAHRSSSSSKESEESTSKEHITDETRNTDGTSSSAKNSGSDSNDDGNETQQPQNSASTSDESNPKGKRQNEQNNDTSSDDNPPKRARFKDEEREEEEEAKSNENEDSKNDSSEENQTPSPDPSPELDEEGSENNSNTADVSVASFNEDNEAKDSKMDEELDKEVETHTRNQNIDNLHHLGLEAPFDDEARALQIQSKSFMSLSPTAELEKLAKKASSPDGQAGVGNKNLKNHALEVVSYFVQQSDATAHKSKKGFRNPNRKPLADRPWHDSVHHKMIRRNMVSVIERRIRQLMKGKSSSCSDSSLSTDSEQNGKSEGSDEANEPDKKTTIIENTMENLESPRLRSRSSSSPSAKKKLKPVSLQRPAWLAQAIENRLYSSAQSFLEYLDKDTIEERVRVAALVSRWRIHRGLKPEEDSHGSPEKLESSTTKNDN